MGQPMRRARVDFSIFSFTVRTKHDPADTTGMDIRVAAPAQCQDSRAKGGAVRGNHTEFSTVYDEHVSFVRRSAKGLGIPDAALDDVCQDVFITVHRQLCQFEGRSSLRTWLFGIVHHVVQSYRRSLLRKCPVHRGDGSLVDPELLESEPDASPYERVANAQATRVARELLGRLNDDQRIVFVLADLEQMRAPEIAATIGANLNTVYDRLRTAREAFALAARRHRAKDEWRAACLAG